VKATKRRLTPSQLKAHLEEQLGFLERSASAFDQGFEGEAKRIAVTLRVLLHDNPKSGSRSLLTQLGERDRHFWDTASPESPGNLLSHSGLTAMRVRSDGSASYVALLDDKPFARRVPFSEWWTATVFRTPEGLSLNRRNMIRTAADQDGGAHVDPLLDETYAKLAHDNALGWELFDGTSSTPIRDPIWPALRQVAHEVLKTLRPGSPKRPIGQHGKFSS
jgi:hypothetical protein